MRVLVDTCVWSLALRRRSGMGDDPWVVRLMRLIQHGEAAILGPIRQELLSGIRDQGQFNRLRDKQSLPSGRRDTGRQLGERDAAVERGVHPALQPNSSVSRPRLSGPVQVHTGRP